MQVRVSPEVNALFDDAIATCVRRGKYFLGVDNVFEAILSRPELLPGEFFTQYEKHLSLTQQQLIRQENWPPSMTHLGTEVYGTPRCARLAHDANRLAQRMNVPRASAGHLLLAILSDAHAAPSRAMDTMSNIRGKLLEDLLKAVSTQQPRPTSDFEAAPAHAQGAGESSSETMTTTKAAVKRKKERASLDKLTRNLSQLAELGKLDKAIGRRKEIFQILEVLHRKNKNNVIIVGEAGVGKTQVVEGLAVALAEGEFRGMDDDYRFVELSLTALMAGTQYRGQFEEKVMALLEELKKRPNLVLFIDEIHLIMGSGSTEGGSVDFANLLKPALARGEIRCVGATTLKEYRKFIERDPALERRFQMVRIQPLTNSATLEVLKHLQPQLERHHDVTITKEALYAAVQLTQRYLPNRHLPDKAIDAVDQACARHRLKLVVIKEKMRQEKSEAPLPKHAGKVTPHDLRKVVGRMSGVPVEEITAADLERLDGLERRLRRQIIGQDEAVLRTVAAVKKARAGLSDPNRPDAVLLYLGPTGVGKSELCKALARQIFGSSDHFASFDMSEYVEQHSVSKLLGAPPGYVGHGEEGRLIQAIRNMPFSILLFDEIEKAHPRIFDIFLPVLDEGRLRDHNGREVSFRNCIIIFTSNIGSECLQRPDSFDEKLLMDSLRRSFRPEFINRIDEIVPFYPLLFEDIRGILGRLVRDLDKRLAERQIGFHMYQGAYELISERGYKPEFGARELRRTFERLVVNPISSKLLENHVHKGDKIEVLVEDGELVFKYGKQAAVSAGDSRG